MKHEDVPPMEEPLMEGIQQEQHERLCAYVFGELQGSERVAFEAELARSSSLRAEHARLVATIGLVKRAVPDEGLSAAVRRDVLASARRSRFRFLSGRRLVQLAAACVVLVGGALALRQIGAGSGASREVRDGMVARLEASLEALEDTKALGYASDAARPAAEAALAKQELAGLRSIGYAEEPPPPATASLGESGEGLEALREGVGEAPAFHALAERMDVQLAGLPHERASGGTLAALEGSAPVGAPAPSGTAGGSSGGRFGERKGPEGPRAGGTYRGPGDSASPAASQGRDNASIDLLTTRVVAPAQAERRELDALGYGGEERVHDEVRGEGQDAFQLGREAVATREQVLAQVEALLAACRVAPGESPRAMFFRYFGDSPFVLASEERTSTFAVDVDTASYALTRAYLKNGVLPPRAAVRTEEFVNYFKADQAPPADGQPFAIGLELAPSLFASDARTEMLRVTVRARDVADFERKPLNLTFVIDRSGSMAADGRLELVKRALALLLRQLYSGDSVAVVAFSNQATLVTPALPAARRGEIEGPIQALTTEGGTNVEAGLRLGYEQALQGLARNAVNRVILCSDGVGNIGETSAKGLLALVQDARAQGIYLNSVGVGMGNHDDAFLEELADQGDGVCNYVDSEAEAKRVFVDGLASLVQPVARDVKIQVEFDPREIESWRLLGYENRALRTQDFKNDKIDAGEVNAGHQVSALYELVRRPSQSRPLATVRLRYKPPHAVDAGREGERARAEAEQALELERTLAASSVLPSFAAASNGYQRAVLVAQFAEVLRQSVHARGDSLATLVREAQRLEKALGDPDFTEFVALLARANPLLDARDKQVTSPVQAKLDELSRRHYELALRERRRELALEAGEPEKTGEERQAEERAAQAERDAIQRLEQEVRGLLGLSGPTPEELESLRALGYGGGDR